MFVLVICINEEDPVKNDGARVFATLYINFSDAQGQLLCNPWSDLAEFRTHSYSYGCHCYLQKNEDPIKNEGDRVLTTFSQL